MHQIFLGVFILENIINKKNRRTLGRRKYKFNNKVLTFFFFVTLSWVFWFLIALDRHYTTNINFPVKYIHQFPDKEMVGEIPDKLLINVSGQGYTLLRTIFTRHNHNINLRVVTLNLNAIKGYDNKYFMLTRTLKDDIKRQLGVELNVNDILPDSLYYTFSNIVRRKIPVEPDINIEFQQQYMFGGSINCLPDCVWVSGPLSIVDTIFELKTNNYKFKKISKSFQIQAQIKSIPRVTIYTNIVSCTVPIEKYTQASIELPIKPINVPDSLRLHIFPSTITVNYNVGLNLYSRITPRLFRVVVDYKHIKNSINNRLKISIERQPAYVKVLSVNPRSVEYIVETATRKHSINN